jgi:hypothetical protein
MTQGISFKIRWCKFMVSEKNDFNNPGVTILHAGHLKDVYGNDSCFEYSLK